MQVTADGSADGVSKVASLAIDGGGQLDLTNNKLIVTSGSVGSWNGSNYDGISGLIKSGRNGGTWDGSGIVTSMTDAGVSSGLTMLAVATAGDCWQEFVWRAIGFVVRCAGDVHVRGRCEFGWADQRGRLLSDRFALQQLPANGAKSFINGDFNYDGQINGDDYALIDASFVGQDAAFSDGPTLDVVSVVPEPAGILAWLGVVGIGGLLGRRRSVHW